MSINASPSDTKARLPMLDGLRGICAISVMLYHCYAWQGIDHFQIGKFGVYFFFMISGFSMWYVYHDRALTHTMLHRFFVARAARIIPLYVLVVLLMFALRLVMEGDAVFSTEDMNRLLLNISMLFGFSLPGKFSYVTGGWSIGIEWVFYVTFPLWLLFVRNLKSALIVLVATIIVNQTYMAAIVSNGLIRDQQPIYLVFASFIVYFAAGITAAFLYARYRYALSAAILRLVPFLVVAGIYMFPTPSNETFLLGWHYPLLVIASIAALTIAGSADKLSALETRFYHFVGEISYSTYLLHFVIYSAWMFIAKRMDIALSMHANAAVVAACTITGAYLTFRFFEAPMRTYINRRFKAVPTGDA